jgi:Holliday junction resolvase RusA-like endonuclease
METKHFDYLAAYNNNQKKVKLLENEVGPNEFDPKVATELIAKWIAESSRSIKLVEDEGFIKLLKYLKPTYEPPKRTTIRTNIQRISNQLRLGLKKKISIECDHYSITNDIWTDRKARAFGSFTIHYISPSFSMENWLLEVEHFPGKHTGEAIQQMISHQMKRWNLNTNNCTMLVRDGASNAKKACRLLDVQHMSCIAHSLHLVIGAAVQKKKSRSQEPENFFPEPSTYPESGSDLDGSDNEECIFENEIQDYYDENVGNVNAYALNVIQDWVESFRKMAVYFHKSPKATNRLKVIQHDISPKDTPKGLKTDCPTRWNSSFDMLNRCLELRASIDHFFGYLETPHGKKEFSDLNLNRPASKEWFGIKCLVRLLAPFQTATKVLSGEKYPTLSLAYPVLRAIRRELERAEIFDEDIAYAGGSEPFVMDALRIVHGVRTSLLYLFRDRFKNICGDLLWTTCLDPRFLSMSHLSNQEKIDVQNELRAQLEEADDLDDDINETIEDESKNQRRLTLDIFGVGTFGCNNNFKDDCEQELNKYFGEKVPCTVDPLNWWKNNKEKYPRMAVLARKWLGCVATSVSSERAFSTSGNTVTARRTSLHPSMVRDIVFIAQNNKSC